MVIAGIADPGGYAGAARNRCASWNGASTPGSRGPCSARASGSARRGSSSAASREVGLVAPRNLAVTYPAGLGQNLRARIVYQGPVRAPIAQGQHIADLVVDTADMPPQTMPLVAESAVARGGLLRPHLVRA